MSCCAIGVLALTMALLPAADAPRVGIEVLSDSGPRWQSEFAGPRRAGDISRDWTDELRLCAGLDPDDNPLACLMMAIHHQAIATRVPELRQQTWMPAFEESDFLAYARRWLGAELSSAQEKAVRKVYAGFAKEYRYQDVPARVGGSFFAGQALLMARFCFGTTTDYEKALENLAGRHGWRAALERVQAPTPDLVRRAIHKSIPVILSWGPTGFHLPLKGQDRDAFMLLGYIETPAQISVVAGFPEKTRMGERVSFELHSTRDQENYKSQPPGTACWNMMEGYKKHKVPWDSLLLPGAELPRGCGLVPWPADGLKGWDAVFVHSIRPGWEMWGPRIAAALAAGSDTAAAPAPGPGVQNADGALWEKHIRGHGPARVTDDWEVLQGLRLCAARNGASAAPAALATVAFRTHPAPGSCTDFCFEWKHFWQTARDERIRQLGPDGIERMAAYYRAREDWRELSDHPIDYYEGRMVWGLSSREQAELRALYDEIRASTPRSAPAALGSTPLEQVAARLRAILGDAGGGSWEADLGVIGAHTGWRAVLSSCRDAGYPVFRKALEMGLPLLVRDPAGTPGVVAGFLEADGKQYLLVADPRAVQPESTPEGVSAEEHLACRLLPSAAPGRAIFEQRATASAALTDAVLHTELPLPAGVSFIEFRAGLYPEVLIIERWEKSIEPLMGRIRPILRDQPPEFQPHITFRLHVPDPWPEGVPKEVVRIECRVREDDVYPAASRKFWLDRDRDKVFREQRTVDFTLLAGAYLVMIEATSQVPLVAGTVSVGEGDSGRTLDMVWGEIPALVPIEIELPSSRPGLDPRRAGRIDLRLSLRDWRHAAIWESGGQDTPSAQALRTTGKVPLRVRPGKYFVLMDGDQDPRRAPGTVTVAADDAGRVLTVQPLTPEEKRVIEHR